MGLPAAAQITWIAAESRTGALLVDRRYYRAAPPGCVRCSAFTKSQSAGVPACSRAAGAEILAVVPDARKIHGDCRSESALLLLAESPDVHPRPAHHRFYGLAELSF